MYVIEIYAKGQGNVNLRKQPVIENIVDAWKEASNFNHKHGEHFAATIRKVA